MSIEPAPMTESGKRIREADQKAYEATVAFAVGRFDQYWQRRLDETVARLNRTVARLEAEYATIQQDADPGDRPENG